MIPLPVIAFAKGLGIKGAIIAALALALAVQTWRHNAADARADACEAGRKADREAVATAQAEAHKRAVAAREAQERRFEQLAKDTDHELAQARLALRGSDADYVARNRLRNEAFGGGGDQAIASGIDSPAGSSDSADPAPVPYAAPFAGFRDPVAVEAADIAICTDNTLRLEAVQAWAKTLNQPAE